MPLLNTGIKQASCLTKYERVRKLLEDCEIYSADYSWPWLSGLPGSVDKKGANKFLLGARMDYGIPADRAWENAEILAETVLGDPDNLWSAMVNTDLDELQAAFRGEHTGKECRRCKTETRQSASSGAAKRHKALHMWPNKTAEAVWKMARIIKDSYGGDARRIWDGLPPDEVLQRLEAATFGPNLSHMVAGALIDTRQIEGRGSLKADLNVTRVLGRVFTGSKTTPDEAHRIADAMEPGNSWILDRRLFGLGQYVCESRKPRCGECCLKGECVYAGGPKA